MTLSSLLNSFVMGSKIYFLFKNYIRRAFVFFYYLVSFEIGRKSSNKRTFAVITFYDTGRFSITEDKISIIKVT